LQKGLIESLRGPGKIADGPQRVGFGIQGRYIGRVGAHGRFQPRQGHRPERPPRLRVITLDSLHERDPHIALQFGVGGVHQIPVEKSYGQIVLRRPGIRLGIIRMTRNAMIGDRVVLDVGSASRHVALQTVVVLTSLLANLERQAATRIFVTTLAALAIEGDALLGSGINVRVMAGDASHAAVAGTKTAAGVHLFHLTDEFLGSRSRRRPHINRQEHVPGQAGAEIERFSASF